jgi:malic enzyme
MPDEQEALRYHREPRPGKTEVVPTKPFFSQTDLSLAYTPGVAVPCLKIRDTPDTSYDCTNRGNLIAVITNGTVVPGLGNIGSLAGKPVMEGNAKIVGPLLMGIDRPFTVLQRNSAMESVVDLIATTAVQAQAKTAQLPDG